MVTKNPKMTSLTIISLLRPNIWLIIVTTDWSWRLYITTRNYEDWLSNSCRHLINLNRDSFLDSWLNYWKTTIIFYSLKGKEYWPHNLLMSYLSILHIINTSFPNFIKTIYHIGSWTWWFWLGKFTNRYECHINTCLGWFCYRHMSIYISHADIYESI